MGDSVLIAMSMLSDGSMSKAVADEARRSNREQFLARCGVTLAQTILVHLTYEGEDYKRYITIGAEQAGDGITQESSLIADALFTQEKNVALLLPIADCIAAVIYDPMNQILGLAHLGRHNLEQQGGEHIIRYMQNEFGIVSAATKVWLSPAAGRANYPLFGFDNRSLHEVALEQLLAAGIEPSNIDIDPRDTTTDATLFSHSEFLKGNRDIDGRQAVVAMMKP